MIDIFHDFYRGKRVLVTGHTGFKGSWLSIWLNELVFVSEVIDVEDDSYFASMILSRRTTDFYQIQTTFHDYFQDLRSKLE